MDSKLLDYIRILSLRDTKTLSQKALKTVEEVGELAKKVLPYEGAFATNHRIVPRDSIIEEVADIMLCAMSIAYDLGATDDEIESMVSEKASQWSNLQARENGGKFPLPFEIHVTVNLVESNVAWQQEDRVHMFRSDCQYIGVKPIILDLQNRQGVSVMSDVMTSSKHFGTNTEAMKAATVIADKLRMKGYKVVRIKLETVPWHPAAPQHPSDPMPQNCYFESHIPVSLHPDAIDSLSTFNANILCGAVHMSRNTFKTLEDGRVVVMLTYRDYNGYASEFKKDVDSIVSQLQHNDFDIGKVHTEFAVYDTKVSHDASWLK